MFALARVCRDGGLLDFERCSFCDSTPPAFDGAGFPRDARGAFDVSLDTFSGLGVFGPWVFVGVR